MTAQNIGVRIMRRSQAVIYTLGSLLSFSILTQSNSLLAQTIANELDLSNQLEDSSGQIN